MTATNRVRDVRLVVTGHDADNQGIIASDTEIGPAPGLAADGWQAYILWASQTLPDLPDDGLAALDTGASGPGSVRLVQCVVYPEGGPAPAGAPEALNSIQRTPGDDSAMHYTHSVDLVIVIDGEVEAVLDTTRTVLKQGDFLVQNGTRHEWHNHGDKPARLGVVVLGTEHRGF
ncbi:cupin domain-containing protein [Streptomyces sp. NPDC055140]